MTSKLERMIQPGETMVFRTRMGWGRTLGSFFKSALLLAGVGGIFFWYSGNPSFFFIVMFSVLPSFFSLHGSEALVTDMRVLHRTGLFKPKVTELPLWHIQNLERVTGYVTLRDRAGLEIHLHSVPDSEGLAEAIVAQTGVPAPRPAQGRVKSWDEIGAFFGIGCGLAMLTLLYVALDRFSGMDTLGWDDPLFFLLLFLLLPGVVLALTLGFIAAMVLIVLAMRFFLSVEEARAFFNPEERLATGPKWALAAAHLPTWIGRRLASLLYGERI